MLHVVEVFFQAILPYCYGSYELNMTVYLVPFFRRELGRLPTSLVCNISSKLSLNRFQALSPLPFCRWEERQGRKREERAWEHFYWVILVSLVFFCLTELIFCNHLQSMSFFYIHHHPPSFFVYMYLLGVWPFLLPNIPCLKIKRTVA